MIQLLSAVNSAVVTPRKMESDGLSGTTDLMSGTASPSGSTSEEFDFRMDDDDDSDENDVVPLDTNDAEKEAALLSTDEDVVPVLVEPEEMEDGYPRINQKDTSLKVEEVPSLEESVEKDTCPQDIQRLVVEDEDTHRPSNSEPQLKSEQRTLTSHSPASSCLVRSPELSRKSRWLRLQRTLGSTAPASDAPDSLGVQFSTVTIRDFPRTIGDNPASSAGLSISIDWKYEAEQTLPLDEYEERRQPRRNGREMIMPPQVREAILREAGFSRAEIVRALRDLNVVRGQRRRTYETLHLQPFQAFTEKLSRKVLNLVTLGEFKRKQRNFINQYHTGVPADKSLSVEDASNQEMYPSTSPNTSLSSDHA
jgi:hypothetical protein